MVEAYMDESGIHDGAHVCVVAGYWGSEKKWIRFENRWREILQAANEPSLKEFHSTEFWNSKGERHGVFAKWSNAKADGFINDLADCIVDAKLFPTDSTLVIDDWKKLNIDERRMLTGGHYNPKIKKWAMPGAPSKTYFLPFQFAVLHPARACNPGLHVHYVFDLNKQFRNHASDLFSLMKKDLTLDCRHQLGSLDMDTGENAPGLQAADMLAYQSYKHAKVRIAHGKPLRVSQLPSLLKRLVANLQDDHDFPYFDAAGLNIALHNLPAELRTPGFTPVTIEKIRKVTK